MLRGQLLRRFKVIVPAAVTTALLAVSPAASALDSADVLPEHINSPAVKIGVISGIGQRYVQDGSLMSLTDYNSITFDAKKLVSMEPRAQQLISVLNQFGQQNMGDALTLGTLKIDLQPQINYIAPVHAYGITKKWTVAVGVPVIHYQNKVTLSQSGSNLEVLRSHAGGLSPELSSAFDELNVSLADAVQKELASKGYKPIASHDDTFIGDVQLVSLYQIFNNKRTALLSKTVFNLPTGPKDDPDDLTDLSTFGQPAIQEVGVLTHMLTPKFRLSGILTAQVNLPDRIDKRVPKSADDGLPDASTKENVNRRTGDMLQVGVSTLYSFASRWSAGAGLDLMAKAADHFWGDRGTRYDLLATDTNQTAATVRLGVTYDTINAYLAKQAFMPGMITYTYSDIVRGLNIARQTTHELWFTMFF